MTLALPVSEWRTGDQHLVPLEALPEAPPAKLGPRVWIDTDAACGAAARTDPDDCFALALVARAPQLGIAGISVVAGNAGIEVVERTTRTLAAQLEEETGRALGVHVGSDALREALRQGPLTLLALGPLTNVATVLRRDPELKKRVTRLVAVMGRRPGHLFHPAEGAGGGMLLGHGPVFRDFNFSLDPQAAAEVLAAGIPVSFVPYDAARGFEIGEAELARLAAAGGSAAWIAGRAVQWLDYWREDIGRDGFFPFDLLAAAYVVRPQDLRCVELRASVREDDALFIPFLRPRALLVDEGATPGAAVHYCHRTREGLKASLLLQLKT